MKLAFVAALLLSSPAFALGPIPNGTYEGKQTCTGQTPVDSKLVFTDDSLIWDDQPNSFEFQTDGSFQVTSRSNHVGRGLGHLTKNGFHYAAEFAIDIGGGKKVFAPGWDWFEYANGKVSLNSSAAAGPEAAISCTGVFSKVQ